MAYPLKDGISLTPAIAADRANRRAAAVSTDEVLVGRIAAGDRLAMQVLYARHHVRLYRFVLRLVRSEAEAEDLVSDTFLDVSAPGRQLQGTICGLDLALVDRAVQGALGAQAAPA